MEQKCLRNTGLRSLFVEHKIKPIFSLMKIPILAFDFASTKLTSDSFCR